MSDRNQAVQVEGLRQLVRTLKAAEGDLDDLKAANQRAGAIVVEAARAGAPKRTSALAASGRANRAAGKANVLFGSARVPYAPPIHWGWPARHIKANPFVMVAAQRTQGAWLAAYEADLQRVLDTVKGDD